MHIKQYVSNPLILQRSAFRKIFLKTNRGVSLYSAFPKSASNHILDLLRIGNNELKIISPKISSGFGHNFIDKEKIYGPILNNFKQILIYGHIPFHSFNDSAIEELGISKIIVSIRPLPDIVVSYKEHVDKGFGPLDYRISGSPESNPNWSKLDDKSKYDYIIKFIIPWYIRYAIGWLAGSEKYSLRFITFEECTQYPNEFLISISKFLNLQITSTSVEEKINNKRPSNMNVGQRGRGCKQLSQEQLSAIRELLYFYGDSILDSNIGKYLLYGYEGLEFDVADVIHDYAQQGASPDRFSAALQSGR